LLWCKYKGVIFELENQSNPHHQPQMPPLCQQLCLVLPCKSNKFGVGAGASHLISGHTSAHQELEEALANAIHAKYGVRYNQRLP
jgi:hypothetical protein